MSHGRSVFEVVIHAGVDLVDALSLSAFIGVPRNDNENHEALCSRLQRGSLRKGDFERVIFSHPTLPDEEPVPIGGGEAG